MVIVLQIQGTNAGARTTSMKANEVEGMLSDVFPLHCGSVIY